MNPRSILLSAVFLAAIAFRGSALAVPLDFPQLQMEVPEAWTVMNTKFEYPVNIIAGGGGAELQIFRTDMDPNQTINSPDELKISVQRVVDSVILNLPNAKLISSTGYDETERSGFALEFVSTDDNATVLRHRLIGWLYRHPDGHQILFTIWAKGTVQDYSPHENEIRQMQAGFAYTGPHEGMVFSSGNGWGLPALVIVMAVAGLLYYRTSKRAKPRMSTMDESGWKCNCGAYNAPDLHQCRQCKQSRLVARVR